MAQKLFDSCIACKHCTLDLSTENYKCDYFEVPLYHGNIGCDFFEKEDRNGLYTNKVC